MQVAIEVSEEQRDELLRLAEARGESGIASLIREAIELYLRNQPDQGEEEVCKALGAKGALRGADADEFEAAVLRQRDHWR